MTASWSPLDDKITAAARLVQLAPVPQDCGQRPGVGLDGGVRRRGASAGDAELPVGHLEGGSAARRDGARSSALRPSAAFGSKSVLRAMTTASTPICCLARREGSDAAEAPEREDDGLELLNALGELVDARAGGRRQRAAPHDSGGLELAQALGEDVGADVGQPRALDIVGERWALLVVRELLLGPKRFTDLRAGLPHVGPDILAQRLRELEASGVLRRGTLPPPAGSRIYELTERGQQLEPVVLALGRFGSVAPFPPGEAADRRRRRGHRPQDALRPGRRRRPERQLRAAPRRAALPPARWPTGVSRSRAGAPRRPTPPSRPTPGTLATVLWHGRDLDEARRAGDLVVTATEEAVTRLLGLFPLPS